MGQQVLARPPTCIGIALMCGSTISSTSIITCTGSTILNQPVMHLLLVKLLGSELRAKLRMGIAIWR